MSSNIDIKLTSQFVGKKAFKQADSAISTLATNAKKLGALFGVTFAARELVNYSKIAMAAAAQDQKSQMLLANSLDNLGLAYAKVDVEGFISSLEKQTAIADDVLRPSFAQLSQVTGSVAKSQKLMKLAFDVSAGAGLDYSSTIDILSQAYVGNYKGLKQLNLGLTQAEMASMSFMQIQDKIQATYTGSGAKALDSYAGQMDKLTIATGNASEKIGYALIDAIIKVSGSKDIDGLVSKIDSLASAFASVVTQVGNAVAALTGNETQKAFSQGFMISGGKAGTYTVGPTGMGNIPMTGGSNMDTQLFVMKQKKKAETDALKRQKELQAVEKARLANQQKMLENAKKAVEEAKKKLALEKAAAVVSQADSLFNLDKIELAAAAMNKQTEEDRVRIRLKQEIMALEEAINSGNVAAAAEIGNAISNDAKLLGMLRGDMFSLNGVPNPFTSWLKTLQEMVAALNAAAAVVIAPPIVKPPSAPNWQQFNPGPGGYEGIGSGTSNTGSGNYGGLAGAGQYGGGGAPVINVNVAGSVTTERDLVSAITKGIYNNQASGTPVGYSTQY